MGFVLSIIYAPSIFIALKFFSPFWVGVFVGISSTLWLCVALWQKKEIIFALFYLGVAILTLLLDEGFFLKLLPLLISLFFLFLFINSYWKKKPILERFVQKFKKQALSEEQKEYLQKSTLYWCFVLGINVVAHIVVLGLSDWIWVFYATIGWYILLFGAVFAQLLYKKL